jgi:hypothetical protein
VATKTPTLPSSDELDLADYKLGSFGSDLDHLRMMLKACSNVITPEEYLRLHAEGIEPEESKYDRDELARIIVFATDVLNDLAGLVALPALGILLLAELAVVQREGLGLDRLCVLPDSGIRQWHETAIKESDDA